MRLVAVVAFVTSAVAGAGCALLSGFDFSGYRGSAEAADATSDAPAAADAASESVVANDASAGDEGNALETGPEENAPVSEDATARDAGDDALDAAAATDALAVSDAADADALYIVHSPVAIATALDPGALAVDDTAAYWIDGANVMGVGVDGGAPFTLFGNPTPLAGTLVLDATNAYWSASTFVQTSFLGGGGKFFFDSVTSPVEALTILAVDATNVYVARINITTQGGGCATTQIDAAPLNRGNGTVTSFTAGVCNVVHMVSDGTSLYWTDTGTFNSFTHPGVWKQPIAGGAPTELAPAQVPAGLAVFRGMVYFGDRNAGQVLRMPADGSAAPSVVAASPLPGDLTVDATGVYWVDGRSSVLRAPVMGGSPQTLASAQTNAGSIATNSTSVFWMNGSLDADGNTAGQVMRLDK